MNNKVEIPLNKAFEVFDQSCHRVFLFSCITNHLTENALPDKWEISGDTIIHVLPPQKKIDKGYILDGYKHFIQCYLVRDCIESFAVCLDKLYSYLLLHGKKKEKDMKKFEKAGLFGKVQLLKKIFS